MIYEIEVNNRDVGVELIKFSDLKKLVFAATSAGRQLDEICKTHIHDPVTETEKQLCIIHILMDSIGDNAIELEGENVRGYLKKSDIVLLPSPNNVIKVSDSVSLVLKEPRLVSLYKYDKSTAEGLYELIRESIDYILHDNVKHEVDGDEILLNLSADVYLELQHYIQSLPDLSVKVELKGSETQIVEIKGFKNIYNYIIERISANNMFETDHFFIQQNFSLDDIGNMFPFEREIFLTQVLSTLKARQSESP